METEIIDKCPHCYSELAEGYNGIYFYCKKHPTYIKYDDNKWNKWIAEQNELEKNSLLKLEKI